MTSIPVVQTVQLTTQQTVQQVVYPAAMPVAVPVPTPVQPVLAQQPVLVAAAQDAKCCWIHRPPGDFRHMPPPPPGRPSQWVQWANGQVTWLPRPVESG